MLTTLVLSFLAASQTGGDCPEAIEPPTAARLDLALGQVARLIAPRALQPEDVAALKEERGWKDSDWQAQVLGLADGPFTWADLSGQLPGMPQKGLVSSLGLQALLADSTAAGTPVVAFGPLRMLAKLGDTTGDGKLTSEEAETLVAALRAGEVEGWRWIPDQALAVLRSQVVARTGEFDALLPGNLKDCELLVKDYSLTCIDERTKVPVVVSYALSSPDNRVRGEVKRLQMFAEETAARIQAKLTDYRRSGLDRGHNKPANDSADAVSMLQSNILSNVSPQTAALNRYTWRVLEHAIHDVVTASGGRAFVFTCDLYMDRWGVPIPLEEARWIGPGEEKNVAVPTHFFKVVFLERGDGIWSGFGWVLPNREDLPDFSDPRGMLAVLRKGAVPVSRIEALTGLTFPTKADAPDLKSSLPPADVQRWLESEAWMVPEWFQQRNAKAGAAP